MSELTPVGFNCSICGEWHDEVPLDASFAEPAGADPAIGSERLPDAEAHGDEFRVRRNGGGTVDRFARGLIELPLSDGSGRRFAYGCWVSLGEASYAAAREARAHEITAEPFFGWLCNDLPGWPSTLLLKTHLHLRAGTTPLIELEPTDHPLAVAQRDGISFERVTELVAPMLHPRP